MSDLLRASAGKEDTADPDDKSAVSEERQKPNVKPKKKTKKKSKKKKNSSLKTLQLPSDVLNSPNDDYRVIPNQSVDDPFTTRAKLNNRSPSD